MNLIEKIKTVGYSVFLVSYVGLMTYTWIEADRREDAQKKVIEIIDTDKDGKLSPKEIKRFYDEMGIEAYTESNFIESIRTKDYEKFLKNYEADSKK